MRTRQVGGSGHNNAQTYRQIAPKPPVKSDSDQKTTAVIDIPVRPRGRPKRCRCTVNLIFYVCKNLQKVVPLLGYYFSSIFICIIFIIFLKCLLGIFASQILLFDALC